MRFLILLLLCSAVPSLAARVVVSEFLQGDGANYTNPGNSQAYSVCNFVVRVQNVQTSPQTVTVSLSNIGISAGFQTGGTNYGANLQYSQIVGGIADGGIKSFVLSGLAPGAGLGVASWSLYVPVRLPVATAASETPSGAMLLNLALANIVGAATFKVSIAENQGAVNAQACVECGLVNLPTPQFFKNCAPLAGGRSF